MEMVSWNNVTQGTKGFDGKCLVSNEEAQWRESEQIGDLIRHQI